FSYHYARRQWHLADDENLRYAALGNFDAALQDLDRKHGILEDEFIQQLALHEDTKQLVYQRGQLLFVFNFHPGESYSGLRIPVPRPSDYQVILNTDDKCFGGFGQVETGAVYPWQKVT